MEISTEKFDILGQEPVRCKISVDNKCLKQVRTFKYLGCKISYENGKDVPQKLANLLKYWGL
jgi:hypothetical protein